MSSFWPDRQSLLWHVRDFAALLLLLLYPSGCLGRYVHPYLATCLFLYASYSQDWITAMTTFAVVSNLANQYVDWELDLCYYTCYACFTGYKLGYARCCAERGVELDPADEYFDEDGEPRPHLLDELRETFPTFVLEAVAEANDLRNEASAEYDRAKAVNAQWDEAKAKVDEALNYIANVKQDLELLAAAQTKSVPHSAVVTEKEEDREDYDRLLKELNKKLAVYARFATEANAKVPDEEIAERCDLTEQTVTSGSGNERVQTLMAVAQSSRSNRLEDFERAKAELRADLEKALQSE